MAYIYKITNDINNKVYVGKTDYSIEKRFNEHWRDANKPSREHRPLYAAMRKYGKEHFHIEVIEETNNPDEREVFWIEQLNSFHYGYNATHGGDGKHYADYELIYALWKNEGKSIIEIQRLTGYDKGTIHAALFSYNIPKEEHDKNHKFGLQKRVAQIDPKTQEIVAIFSSAAEAESKCNGQHHIMDVCKGKRRIAGGYMWKFVEEE